MDDWNMSEILGFQETIHDYCGILDEIDSWHKNYTMINYKSGE